MTKQIKYKIHFGNKSFCVDEWLYNYFNKVKNNNKKYNELYKILCGVNLIDTNNIAARKDELHGMIKNIQEREKQLR